MVVSASCQRPGWPSDRLHTSHSLAEPVSLPAPQGLAPPQRTFPGSGARSRPRRESPRVPAAAGTGASPARGMQWEGTLNCRRSQTLRAPSSPPLSRKGSRRLQWMTLASPSWAAAVVSMQALLGAARVSQMRMEASAEQEANTWKREGLSDPRVPRPHPRPGSSHRPLARTCPRPSLTVSSVGDHCRSSTERVWPTKGRWSTCQEPPSAGVQRWMFF